jgi:hypothetical protein
MASDQYFTETETGWVAELSTLEANLVGVSLELRDGSQYDSINDFLSVCTPHRNNEDELTHWIYTNHEGKTVTIFNT